MSERYASIPGSRSCHCCFEFTVVDTSTAKEDRPGDTICECFDEASADKVAAALNLMERLSFYCEGCGQDKPATAFINKDPALLPSICDACKAILKEGKNG